jgi:hypothetical protein
VSLKIDENTFIPYTYVDLAGAGNKTVSLPPGTYLVEFRFLSHNVEETSPTETLRIDSGQEAVSTQVAISGTAFPEPQGFSSAAALKEYLDRQPENTKDNPYRIKFAGADLSSKETKGETLNTLYKVINRYVTLDLRGCTGKELIAASTARLSNRGKIVSLVLPDSVTEINANGFSGYTSLKSVVMPKVKTIHPSAFKNCLALETVFAPELETVIEATTNDAGAFAGCTALKALYCPSLVTLGKYAVYGCTSLTEAAFPRLETIGGLAFKRCATLKALSLPKIKNIDDGGFEEDSALLYLIFGDPPEFDETTVFRSTDFSKKGTIYVPSDSLDAYANWTDLKELVKSLPVL